MSQSRRDFLQSMIPQMKNREIIKEDNRCELTLGHMNVFPVNTETKIKIRDYDLLVKSVPEGLQLVDVNSETHFRLSLSRQGQIIAIMGEIWPANAVLSLFSGEVYFL